jgi:hypothetical protein
MRITHKNLVTFAASLLALMTAGLAQASLISFSFEGEIMSSPFGDPNVLPLGSKIDVTGVFEDNNAPLDGDILFSGVSGNTLSIDLLSLGILTEVNDARYDMPGQTQGAFLTFSSGTLTGFDYRSYYYDGDNPLGIKFTTGDMIFDNGLPNTIYGEWDPGSLLLTAIPVPPAAWLFGSGLIGLSEVARRTRTA